MYYLCFCLNPVKDVLKVLKSVRNDSKKNEHDVKYKSTPLIVCLVKAEKGIFTFSLCNSSLSSSLSFWAFAILCKSARSLSSLLKEDAGGVSEYRLLDDTRVLAFSDISKASLSGREWGALSDNLEGISLSGLPVWFSAVLLLSAAGGDCSGESVAGTGGSPGLSEGTTAALRGALVCLLSSELLRRLGD